MVFVRVFNPLPPPQPFGNKLKLDNRAVPPRGYPTCFPAFYFFSAIHFRYALINGSISPSITASTCARSSFVL